MFNQGFPRTENFTEQLFMSDVRIFALQCSSQVISIAATQFFMPNLGFSVPSDRDDLF